MNLGDSFVWVFLHRGCLVFFAELIVAQMKSLAVSVPGLWEGFVCAFVRRRVFYLFAFVWVCFGDRLGVIWVEILFSLWRRRGFHVPFVFRVLC